jgi:hypothetical protein
MAKLSLGDKVERVIKLLLGLRNPKIAEVLMAHGFSDEDLQEGWELLRQVTRTRLALVPSAATMDPTLLQRLDEWENRWFRIAAATLKRRAPKVYASMFLNLVQTEGAAVIVSVGTFVERYDLLSAPADKGGMGTAGKEAKKLLEKRGMKAEVIGEARDLLKRLGAVETAKPAKDAPPEEDYSKAETELWAWYLEWSDIARTAIKDRRQLRQLGFLKTTKRGGSVEEELEETDEGEEEAVPEGEPAAGEDTKKTDK